MKMHLAAAAAALLVCLVSALPASASIAFAEDEDDIRLYNGPGENGGIFHVDVLGSSSSPLINGYDFDTFCVQVDEFINLSDGGAQTYHVASITDHTVLGDRPLGSFAAWLYTKFLEPALTGVANSGLKLIAGTGGIFFNPLDATDANAVQKGIWRSMGFLGSLPIGTVDELLLSNMHAAYLADSWSTITANADNSWNYGSFTGNVAIMNLIGPNGSLANAQDQLVYIPPPGGSVPQVPEPMSFLVWSMLAMCVGTAGLRRRGD